MDDIFFMKKALCEAEKAYALGEVPVGAVITDGAGKMISCGRNTREENKNALCHAEMNAADMACKVIGGKNLSGLTLYVTLEPCPMCAGLCVMSGISRVVFGAYDEKNGAVSSKMRIFDGGFTHRPDFTGGVLKEESAELLSRFFKERRKNKKSISFSYPAAEYQNEKYRALSGKDISEGAVFIRKNGKTAGTAVVSDGALTDINILKEYSFCLSEEEAIKAFGEDNKNEK